MQLLHSVAIMFIERQMGSARAGWLLLSVQKWESPCVFGEDENFKISVTRQQKQL